MNGGAFPGQITPHVLRVSTENTGASKTPLGIGGAIKATETRAILEALERNRKNPWPLPVHWGCIKVAFPGKSTAWASHCPGRTGGLDQGCNRVASMIP
jgi:hypothetical protein